MTFSDQFDSPCNFGDNAFAVSAIKYADEESARAVFGDFLLSSEEAATLVIELIYVRFGYADRETRDERGDSGPVWHGNVSGSVVGAKPIWYAQYGRNAKTGIPS